MINVIMSILFMKGRRKWVRVYNYF
jgi:hypothetical protein